MNPLLLLALAGGAFYFLGQKDTAGKLQYFFQSVKLKGSLLKPELDYITDVVNPTQRSLTVDNIFANVYADDQRIGRIEVTTSFTIPKASTKTIGIPIQLITGVGVAAIIKAITNKKIPTLKIVGTVRSSGVTSPINESFELPL
jgi:LEA14-like dessication related protein